MSSSLRRWIALALLIGGVALFAMWFTGFGAESRAAAKVVVLAPTCLLLGIGGLVRPGVIGNDTHLHPTDRQIELVLVVAGVFSGLAVGWLTL